MYGSEENGIFFSITAICFFNTIIRPTFLPSVKYGLLLIQNQ